MASSQEASQPEPDSQAFPVKVRGWHKQAPPELPKMYRTRNRDTDMAQSLILCAVHTDGKREEGNVLH